MRRMLVAGFVLACAAFFAGDAVQGQRTATPPPAETILLGSTTLTLGMPQQKVIDSLADRYSVEKTPGGGSGPYSSWMIQTRGNPSVGIPTTMMGNVAFKDGRLTSVIKYWGPEDQEKGAELASALYGALAQFVKEGKRSCLIDVGTNQSPRAEMKSAFIVCGGKYIDVTISRSGGTDLVSLNEILQIHK